MNSKVIKSVWLFSFILGLIAEFSYNFPMELSIILPAIYLFLSFIVFDKFVIGYRIFHHLCIVFLSLYFILGLIIQLPKILSNKGISEHLAYSWFSTLSTTYLFFLIMFSIAYFPYFMWKKYKVSK